MLTARFRLISLILVVAGVVLAPRIRAGSPLPPRAAIVKTTSGAAGSDVGAAAARLLTARLARRPGQSVLEPPIERAAAQAGVAFAQSDDGVWEVLPTSPAPTLPAVASTPSGSGFAGPRAVVRLNRSALDAVLARAPLENDQVQPPSVLSLPLPDGRFGRFRVESSPILEPALAAMFPEIQTYRGTGIDDPTATARIDWTADGLHAIVFAAGATVYLDPSAPGDVVTYVSYDKGAPPTDTTGFVCLVGQNASDPGSLTGGFANALPFSNGAIKRTYRLLLAATGEYTAAAGGTKASAVARMTTTINRVNGIYERELGVHLTMATGTAADPTALIYTSAATDPYTNSDNATMLVENQANLTGVVGSANYDVGHVFSTGGGGIATLNSVCGSTVKARGVSGTLNSSGDSFDVDIVSHELGHQFGANHTFNSISSACNGNRSTAHAYEVGSGSTIMSYGNGNCMPENLQQRKDDFFNVESLNEMTAFLSGTGGSCAVTSASGNAVPNVAAGAGVTIPQGTPFALTAAGNDDNGDTLTYIWEQYNLGAASTSVASASTDDGSRPLFRSYVPSTNPTRVFPSINYILSNANVPPQTRGCPFTTCLTGEVLPSTNRTMTFQVTVRDNRAGAGAIASASMQVTATTAAGPFVVTAPNNALSWAGNSLRTVTWSVANTSAPPVNALNVKISLSTDGGLTFPTVLAASAPNIGTAEIFVPNMPTNTARVKIEAVGNVFFDISDTDFTIGAPGCTFTVVPSTAPIERGATAGNVASVTASSPDCAWTAASSASWLTLTSAPGGIGDGSVTYSTIANSGGPRSGTLTIAGRTVIVTQSAGSSPGGSIDADADGRGDISVYRPSTGYWYVRQSHSGYSLGSYLAYQWGLPGDLPIPGDFDGDRQTDLVVYRPTTGEWFIRYSSAAYAVTGHGSYQWGLLGDMPLVADFDGDGRTDLTVYRPSTGEWFIRYSSAGYAVQGYRAYQWGLPGDTPMVADFDNDGRTDLTVYRPSTGEWFIRYSSMGYTVSGYGSYQWGLPDDTPIATDFDGDGKTDLAVYRPTTGEWFIRYSTAAYAIAGSYGVYQWGLPGDAPLVGDFDGDRRTDLAVYRPATGEWFIRYSTSSYSYANFAQFQWGLTGDWPID